MKIVITYAPRAVKRETVNEFEENKKADFPTSYFILYEKSKTQDDTGDPIFTVALFKQIGGRPIRGDADLDEVLKYFKRHNSKKGDRVQLLNLDEVNKALASDKN